MIGRPLMVMPFSSAASRAPVTGAPLLLGPSPEISMTRRKPRYGFSSNNGIAKLIAPDIEVRDARRIGAPIPATSPPAIVPATSTAPIETHQRIAALPSYAAMVTRKPAFGKREHRLSLHIRVSEIAS